MKYFCLLIALPIANIFLQAEFCVAQQHEKITKLANHNIKLERFDSLGHIFQEFVYFNTDTPVFGNGYFKTYYKSGKLESIGHVKQGKKDSLYYNYYADGRIFEKFFYKDDDPIGGQYKYDSMPNIIYEYFFRLMSEGYSFHYFYNPYSKKYTFEGKPIITMLNYFDSKDPNSSDTVSLDCFLAIPENLRSTLTIKSFRDGKWDSLEKKGNYYEYFYNMPVFLQHYYCKNGQGTFVTTLKLYDTSTNKLVYKGSDTTKFIRKNPH